MNIAGVQALALDFDTSSATRADRLTSWTDEARVASPMAPYPRYAAVRNSWTPDWPSVGVVVTADDGSQGLGIGTLGHPLAALVEDYFGPRITGEPALATGARTRSPRLVSDRFCTVADFGIERTPW